MRADFKLAVNICKVVCLNVEFGAKLEAWMIKTLEFGEMHCERRIQGDEGGWENDVLEGGIVEEMVIAEVTPIFIGYCIIVQENLLWLSKGICQLGNHSQFMPVYHNLEQICAGELELAQAKLFAIVLNLQPSLTLPFPHNMPITVGY